MTVIVNMHEAKSQLSKLVERARMGEDVVIAKDGTPVARLLPVASTAQERPVGLYAGKVVLHEDFDAPLADEFTGASM